MYLNTLKSSCDFCQRWKVSTRNRKSSPIRFDPAMSLPPIKKRSPRFEQGPSIGIKTEPLESYPRTPFTAPKHRRGVDWEKNIPESCRRGAQGVDGARKDFALDLVRRLAEENKSAWTIRWLCVYLLRVSQQFTDIFRQGRWFNS
jgi:hypothetical protein